MRKVFYIENILIPMVSKEGVRVLGTDEQSVIITLTLIHLLPEGSPRLCLCDCHHACLPTDSHTYSHTYTRSCTAHVSPMAKTVLIRLTGALMNQQDLGALVYGQDLEMLICQQPRTHPKQNRHKDV
ncbi:hypothetical protein PoB_000652100 [Plakobranchus ocellatus]|uniref:Uncharacterized protein n=1 Tax=Plakobranchus ocellatus TaxID=259542 RepID=A0AAV3XYI9_9GAST|nr:hypothetical protein PoB_000652100 [Plakobranchus ocellatus]